MCWATVSGARHSSAMTPIRKCWPSAASILPLRRLRKVNGRPAAHTNPTHVLRGDGFRGCATLRLIASYVEAQHAHYLPKVLDAAGLHILGDLRLNQWRDSKKTRFSSRRDSTKTAEILALVVVPGSSIKTRRPPPETHETARYSFGNGFYCPDITFWLGGFEATSSSHNLSYLFLSCITSRLAVSNALSLDYFRGGGMARVPVQSSALPPFETSRVQSPGGTQAGGEIPSYLRAQWGCRRWTIMSSSKLPSYHKEGRG